ncbi:MAG: DNA polymerase [Patescibacteria group bacterium]
MSKTEIKSKTLVLLDVHAILHRAYHALPDFTTKSGEPTGGLYGLVSMLIKLATDLKPDYFIACYDLPEPTFRKAVYKEYKAGRKPTDSALVSQIERSREVFEGLNIPCYELAGFEADDLVGTLAEQAKQDKSLKIIIASGDLDTLQLVDGTHVQVYTFKKGLNDTMLYDEAAVKTRFGFAPELLPDWKGFRGDPSDNIIGITGIGEKTATTLITNFGPVEKIYKVLKKDVSTFKKLKFTDRVINLLTAGEEEALFSKTLATIRRDAPVELRLPSATWREGVTMTAVDSLFDRLEFRSLKERWHKLFQIEKTEGSKLDLPSSKQTDPEPEAGALRELQILAWLLNSERDHLDWAALKELTGATDLTHARAWLETEIKKANLTRVWAEIESPLISILDAARGRGILLDRVLLKNLSVSMHQELTILEQKIYALAGHEFNLNSPKQLGQILFDELKLPIKGLKKTAGGARSTRESELLKLAPEFPIVSEILAYRERQKLLSTYIDALPELVAPDGALHATFDQMGAATGRLSSRDPNLQNIPTPGSLGGVIRQAFQARAGHRFIALDYSQIEMRVLAVLSGDAALIEMFRAGGDIHTAVASRVFGVEPSGVTPEMRRQAKVINFGIIYGMGVNALRANLGTTREAATEFYTRYFATFPTIRNYFDQVKATARTRGYTETEFGRRRYLPTLRSPLPFLRAEGERMAMNAPIQGTAADIIKLAMIKTDAALRQAGLINDAHLLLTVHDELLYEVKEELIPKIKPILVKTMETVVDWPIPLSVKVASGSNWGELEV